MKERALPVELWLYIAQKMKQQDKKALSATKKLLREILLPEIFFSIRFGARPPVAVKYTRNFRLKRVGPKIPPRIIDSLVTDTNGAKLAHHFRHATVTGKAGLSTFASYDWNLPHGNHCVESVLFMLPRLQLLVLYRMNFTKELFHWLLGNETLQDLELSSCVHPTPVPFEIRISPSKLSLAKLTLKNQWSSSNLILQTLVATCSATLKFVALCYLKLPEDVVNIFTGVGLQLRELRLAVYDYWGASTVQSILKTHPSLESVHLWLSEPIYGPRAIMDKSHTSPLFLPNLVNLHASEYVASALLLLRPLRVLRITRCDSVTVNALTRTTSLEGYRSLTLHFTEKTAFELFLQIIIVPRSLVVNLVDLEVSFIDDTSWTGALALIKELSITRKIIRSLRSLVISVETIGNEGLEGTNTLYTDSLTRLDTRLPRLEYFELRCRVKRLNEDHADTATLCSSPICMGEWCLTREQGGNETKTRWNNSSSKEVLH